MNTSILSLFSWEHGIGIIAVFAVVSLILIAAVVSLMSGGKKNKTSQSETESSS